MSTTEKMEEGEDDFKLYSFTESSGKCHTALRVPKSLPSHYDPEVAKGNNDVYNILMADISGSMYGYWPSIVTGWQEHIKDKLTGRTNIYCFGDEIKLKRESTELTPEDFTIDASNDLTGALRTVRLKVEECVESNVRVFIIADGAHDHGEPLPESEIIQMKSHPEKTVTVFVFGVGYEFPVHNSIDIRSRMHNGNANIPSLFWAKETEDIIDQMAAMGEELNASLVKLTLNLEGYIVPGLCKTSNIHLGEWVYFEQSPDELPSMSVRVNDTEPDAISTACKPVNMRQLLSEVFRQWNSVLVQQHRKKEHVPLETFELMESIFTYNMENMKKEMPKGKDVKSRLARKNVKAYEIEFRTLLNQSKKLISLENKYRNELELAETILMSTVTNRKYDTKNLRLRGHSQDDYKEDMKAFQKLYEKALSQIKSLPSPTPEDCCRVTITSTIVDLQDPDFHLMFEENKFDFLRSFTMSGIPIYAPVRDSSQINPWTMVIKHILVTPFTILSQLVLEESAAADADVLGSEDKDVLLQQDNEQTRFNAIIPLVPASAADILKPLVLSNIYAMMATFCIMKNPHIIDYNAHLAALGCAWTRTVREFPVKTRPEYARERLANIVSTAKIYMDRPSVVHYVDAMINHPKQALMTESTDEFNGKTLKCESLVKPAFFMHLKKDKMSQQQICHLLKLLSFEYIGRCLSNSHTDAEATPFTDFFCIELADPEKRKAWLQKQSKTIIDGFHESEGTLLERFYTLDDLLSSLKKFVAGQVMAMTSKLLEGVSLEVNMGKVKKLQNYGGCGDIRWTSFQTLAQEMNVPEEDIEEMFKPSEITVYVYEALKVRNSRERLAKDLPKAESVMEEVKKKVTQENTRTLRVALLKEVEESTVSKWREAYMKVHGSSLVMPMTTQQLVEAAQARNIQVTNETFNQVYRYSERVGLVRNACQIPECPHYLQPRNNFNQHLSIEREQETFPHSLHLISRKFCGRGTDGVVEEVVSGKHTGTRKRKRPTPPERTVLEPLTDQLIEVLKVYAEKGDESSMQDSETLENDDETFYDCN